MCMYIYICLCVCVYIYTPIHVYACIHTHTHVCIYTYGYLGCLQQIRECIEESNIGSYFRVQSISYVISVGSIQMASNRADGGKCLMIL